MTDDKKQSRRPVAGSRSPSTAPRRVAGRSVRPDPEQGEQARPVRTAGAVQAPDRAPAEAAPAASTPATGRRPRRAEDAVDREPGALSSPRTTRVLLGLLVALLVVGVVESGVWAWSRYSGGDDRQHVLSFEEDYVVHDDPIIVPMADWRDANDVAMKSVTEILNVSWKDYDQNLEDARKLITDNFEKEYASTTKDSRDLFLKSKAEYDFAVVGTSVVEATPDEVATLLFLNQYVYKGEGKQRTGPEIYPVRVMVRMVRSDSGWLIDELKAL